MNPIPIGRKYALAIVMAESGSAQSIQFYNRALGFGTFSSADLLDAREDVPSGTTMMVDEDRIEETLLSLILDRRSITALPDFAQFLPVDAIGSPCVYRYELHCSNCGHDWQDAMPDVAEIISCERCRSRVEVEPSDIHWQGPPEPTLRTLWRSLPGPVSFHVEFPGRFLVYPTEAGLAIKSPEGQRFLLARGAGAVTITAIRGRARNVQTRVLRIPDTPIPEKDA